MHDKCKLLPQYSTILLSVKTYKTYVKSKFLTQKNAKKEKKKVEHKKKINFKNYNNLQYLSYLILNYLIFIIHII